MGISNDSIDRIKLEVINCKLCNLCINRTNAVPGDGNPKANIMFIGEALEGTKMRKVNHL